MNALSDENILKDSSETSTFDLFDKEEFNRSKKHAVSGVSTTQLCPQCGGTEKLHKSAMLSEATALAECSAAGQLYTQSPPVK